MFLLKKIVLVLVLLIISASAEAKSKENSFDWGRVMSAIIQVESRGDTNAVSGRCCGPMQIAPILVKECNKILSKKGSKKRYTLKDRFDVLKSKEMFLVFQSHYNPSNNVEFAIRSWNGGIHYKKRSTDSYYRKVVAKMKKSN